MPCSLSGSQVSFLEESLCQPWIRLSVPGLDVRFFLKGPMLDAGRGNAALSRSALSPVLGEPVPLIAPKQVHGTSIIDATSIINASAENVSLGNIPLDAEADGVLFGAGEAGLEASLRFADCAPVVVSPSREWVERVGTSWVLIMHSGYKGTVLNITRSGLDMTRARYGASALEGAWAWIGPCIGMKNYPRDREEWTSRGLDAFRAVNVKISGEKVFFDIAGELRLQLTDAGIADERVFLFRSETESNSGALSGADTFERPDICYSYRSGERQRRMFLLARSFSEPRTLPQ